MSIERTYEAGWRVGTYDQYNERLLKMKPNVYLHGKKVDRSNGVEGEGRDLAPWIVGGTYVMQQCYDTANDPRYEDVCVVKSHITGHYINRCTHIHHSVDDLLKKQLMTRLICHRVGGCMQRCMGTDAMNALFSVCLLYTSGNAVSQKKFSARSGQLGRLCTRSHLSFAHIVFCDALPDYKYRQSL